MNDEENEIQKRAVEFARKNKKQIARRLTDPTIFTPEEEPVSVFMTGSPGAGKTEASKALLEKHESDGSKVLRIDPDDLRSEFTDYCGTNSSLFQHPVSILVDKIHDLAIKQKQSFLLDGTLSRYDAAEQNIRRSVKRNRFVQILYVYQEPKLAWEFVVARAKLEGRVIPVQQFIEQYFAARDVVNRIKAEYGDKVRVDLLLKNIDGSDNVYKANIDLIDNFSPEKYTKEQVETIIGTN